MKVSDLIKQLELLKTEHGDIDVVVHSLSHSWPPEPEVRRVGGGKPMACDAGPTKYILLNP